MNLGITTLLVGFILVPILHTNSLHDDTIETPQIRMKPQFTGIKTRIISRSKSASETHDKIRYNILRDKPASRSTFRLSSDDNNVNRRRFRTTRNNRRRKITKLTDYSPSKNQIVKPLDLHGIATQYESLSSRSKQYRNRYEEPNIYGGNSLDYKSLQNDEVRNPSKRGIIIGGPLGVKGTNLYLSQPKIISRVYKPGSSEPVVTYVVGTPDDSDSVVGTPDDSVISSTKEDFNLIIGANLR